MTNELICENCGKEIPDCMNHIEYDTPTGYLIFCNEDCEDEYNRG